MLIGLLYGIAAALIYAMSYIFPLLVKQYDPVVLSLARYGIFAYFSLIPAVRDFQALKSLERRDWIDAFLLGFIGSLIYYWILSAAVVRAGAVVAGAFSAMIPVVAAVYANATEKNPAHKVAWRSLVVPMCLIISGIGILNWSEFLKLVHGGVSNTFDFMVGVFLAFIALFIWTWYPIKNARWLLAHPSSSSRAWATAQGLALIAPTTIGAAAYVSLNPDALPGPAPEDLLVAGLFLGIGTAWLATLLWNQMSKRMPPALTGQMLVLETIFTVIYAHVLRSELPDFNAVLGTSLLVAGIAASGWVFYKKSLEYSSQGGH